MNRIGNAVTHYRLILQKFAEKPAIFFLGVAYSAKLRKRRGRVFRKERIARSVIRNAHRG